MSAPLALVYRGNAAKPSECSDAVAGLLADSPHGFDVRFVGPKQELRLTSEVLSRAVLYAQPGGGELGPAYRRMRRYRDTIRAYVAAGGRYLGVCLGGYLAGATPGFALIPGDTDQYVRTRGATVRTTGDTLVEIHCRRLRRYLYFQDGPVFRIDRSATDVDVLARYPNGELAALVARFGAGRVGVIGPHPEATPDWYRDSGLADPDPHHAELGHDLIDALMGGTPATTRLDGARPRRIS